MMLNDGITYFTQSIINPMNSLFPFVVGLLTAALSLFGFVEQHPELPQSLRDQAQQIAEQAITQATQSLAMSPSGGTTSSVNPAHPVAQISSVNFTAPHYSGVAPFFVDFIADNNGTVSNIDFGDGVSGPVHNFEDSAPTKYQISFVHTYAQAGSYTATLKDSFGNFLGTAAITVMSGTSHTTTNFSVSPTSGAAPLTVTFFIPATINRATPVQITFGDEKSQVGSFAAGPDECGSSLDIPTNSRAYVPCTHVYNAPGTFTAYVYAADKNIIGTAMITVKGTPAATINENSLVSGSAHPTITGHATQTSGLVVTLTDDSTGKVIEPGDHVAVINGTWTDTINPYLMSSSQPPVLMQPPVLVAVAPGIYTVKVYDENEATILATGTLTVNSP